MTMLCMKTCWYWTSIVKVICICNRGSSFWRHSVYNIHIDGHSSHLQPTHCTL